MALKISNTMEISDDELVFTAIRSQGAGGQNVNKVSTAVQLRFDISASRSLPEKCKQLLLALRDQRVSSDGIVVIKSQEFRSQVRNKQAALERLRELIQDALAQRKPRKPTRPTKSSQRQRLDSKSRHGQLKKSRGRIAE